MLRKFRIWALRGRRPEPRDELMDGVVASCELVVRTLMSALAERDHQTGQHSCRVAPMALRIAAEAGWAPHGRDWLALEYAARLHDIGKIGVPDAVLRKPSGLLPHEWVEMRRHPEAAFRILQEVDLLASVADIVRSHHERWDGRGYPRGLRGGGISEGARVLAVADAFDAMTSQRPYRRALPPERALAEIAANEGTQFDPRLVGAFQACYGDLVDLVEGQEDGREGVA